MGKKKEENMEMGRKLFNMILKVSTSQNLLIGMILITIMIKLDYSGLTTGSCDNPGR